MRFEYEDGVMRIEGSEVIIRGKYRSGAFEPVDVQRSS